MKSISKHACFDDPSFTPIKLGHVFLVAILTALIGCQSSSVSDLNRAAEGYSPQDTDKLFIVDCLLPGQIRKLGSQMTYLSARRPVKTTAGDCEIRGGEYVAYDRANYASALKVWLPQAQQGDVEAQVTLGEIYEKGLGGVADPKLAAQWYLKAAEQGNSRAKVNLGYLYEKGLGVKQDKSAALNWYRKASGLENSDLQFASAGEVTVSSDYQQQLEKLRQESKGYKEEAESLRKQLDTTQQQLSLQKQKLLTIENQLENNRNKLNQEKGKSTRNEKLIQSLQKDLETNQSNLDIQQQQVSQLESKLKNEQTQVIAKPETVFIPKDLEAKQPSLETQRHQVSKPKRKLKYKPKQIIAKSKSDTISKPDIVSKSDTISKEERNREQQIELAKNKLGEMNAQLQTMEANYHSTFVQIKVDMDKIDESSELAKTTQDELVLEKLRANLTQAKSDLSDQGKQIKELKNSISVAQSSLESLENQPTLQVVQTGPVIELIDPPITLTRGDPSYQLRSVTKSKDIIGKIVPVSDLKKLEVNEQVIQADKKGIFKSQVAIVEPLTVVKIVAIDKRDNRSIMTFNLLSQTQEASQAANEAPERTVSSSYPSINFGQFYALIIGNNDYANMPALKTSVNDAKAIDEILRVRYGYKTTLLINANRHQIMTALNSLRNKLTENDNLVIYYAGHGDIDKSDQSAYWLPTDAEANNSANWLSSHNIAQYLNVILAKHILLIADSCYSGAMTTSSIARIPDDMPESKREKWLNFMINRKARTVITSGGVKPVLDSGSGNHSIFANALLKALKSNKGLMEDYKLYRAVASKVKQSASNIGFQQMPQYSAMQHAGHEGSPFFFVPRS